MEEYIPDEESKLMFLRLLFEKHHPRVNVANHSAFHKRFMYATTMCQQLRGHAEDKASHVEYVCEDNSEGKTVTPMSPVMLAFCFIHACMSTEWQCSVKSESDIPLCLRLLCKDMGEAGSALMNGMYRNVRLEQSCTPWMGTGGGKREKITVCNANNAYAKHYTDTACRSDNTNLLAAVYMLCEYVFTTGDQEMERFKKFIGCGFASTVPRGTRSFGQEAFHYVAWSVFNYSSAHLTPKLMALNERRCENRVSFFLGELVLNAVIMNMSPAPQKRQRSTNVDEATSFLASRLAGMQDTINLIKGFPADGILSDKDAVLFCDTDPEDMRWKFDVTEVISVEDLCARLDSRPDCTVDAMRVQEYLNTTISRSLTDLVVLVFPKGTRLYRVRQTVESAFRVAPFLAPILEPPLLVDSAGSQDGPYLLLTCRTLFALRTVLTGYMAENQVRLSNRFIMHPLLSRMWFCEPVAFVPLSASIDCTDNVCKVGGASSSNWLHRVAKFTSIRVLMHWISTSKHLETYILPVEDPRFVVYDMLPMLISRWSRVVDVQMEVEYELKMKTGDYDLEEMLDLISIKPTVCATAETAYSDIRTQNIQYRFAHKRMKSKLEQPVPDLTRDTRRKNDASERTIRSLFGVILDFININAPRMVLTYYLRRIYMALVGPTRANGKNSRAHFCENLPERMSTDFHELYLFVLSTNYKCTNEGYVAYTRIEIPAGNPVFNECWPEKDQTERNWLLTCSFYAFLCSDCVDDVMARKLLHSVCLSRNVDVAQVNLVIQNKGSTAPKHLVEMLTRYSDTTLSLFPRFQQSSASGNGTTNINSADRMEVIWNPKRRSTATDSAEFKRKYLHNTSYMRVETTDHERRFYCHHMTMFMQCLEWCITYYGGEGMDKARNKMKEARVLRNGLRKAKLEQKQKQSQMRSQTHEQACTQLQTQGKDENTLMDSGSFSQFPDYLAVDTAENEANTLLQEAMCMRASRITTRRDVAHMECVHASRVITGPCVFDQQSMLDENNGVALPIVVKHSSEKGLNFLYLETGMFVPLEPCVNTNSDTWFPGAAKPGSCDFGGIPPDSTVSIPNLLDAVAYYYTNDLNKLVDPKTVTNNNIFSSVTTYSRKIARDRETKLQRELVKAARQTRLTPQEITLKYIMKESGINEYGGNASQKEWESMVVSAISNRAVFKQQHIYIS